MPIEYRIDSEKRIVFADVRGAITMQDLFAYQKEVWSRPDVARFRELMDFTNAIAPPDATTEAIKDLATLEAEMDVTAHAPRLAIVASEDFLYGLGRMYEAYRELQSPNSKEIEVFRTREEALRWLGVDDAGE